MDLKWVKYALAGMAILLLTLLLIPVIVNFPTIITVITKPEHLKAWLDSYGPLSVVVFISLQVLTMVVTPIPSEVLLITGGYLYGAIPGTFLSLLGILIGSVVVFWLSRNYGMRLVKTFVPPKSLEKFSRLLNYPKLDRILFILYLIPEIPKDILTYIAGLTPISFFRFICLTMIARLPCILGASLIGAKLQQKDYTMVIILITISSMVLVGGFFFKDRILAGLSLEKSAEKETNSPKSLPTGD